MGTGWAPGSGSQMWGRRTRAQTDSEQVDVAKKASGGMWGGGGLGVPIRAGRGGRRLLRGTSRETRGHCQRECTQGVCVDTCQVLGGASVGPRGTGAQRGAGGWERGPELAGSGGTCEAEAHEPG